MKVEVRPVTEMERVSLDVTDDVMVVEPIFWKPTQVATVGAVTVRDEHDRVLFTGILRVSGQNGRASLIARKKPVRPVVDGKTPKGK